jgi:hypothetical protein
MGAAEAIGAYSAANFCGEIGIPNTILEGDSHVKLVSVNRYFFSFSFSFF